jgi:hypothetical protein
MAMIHGKKINTLYRHMVLLLSVALFYGTCGAEPPLNLLSEDHLRTAEIFTFFPSIGFRRDVFFLRRPPVSCFAGSYDIEGPPLTTGREAGSGSEFSLFGVQVSIPDVCPETAARVRLSRNGTEVLAYWRTCPGLPHGGRLSALIDGFACRNVVGTFYSPDLPSRRLFHAFLKPIAEDGSDTVDGESDQGGGGQGNARLQIMFQRSYWAHARRAYPAGYIPTGSLAKAGEQLVLAPYSFDRFQSLGGPAAGSVAALAIDPLDTAHWLAGGSYGGIWETSNAGTTWSPRTDDQLSLAISAIAFAPQYPNVVYAGTGTHSPLPTIAYPGIGILKSTDGGSTWGRLAASTFTGLGFSAIRVSDDPTLAVAATIEPIAYMYPAAHIPPGTPQPGVYLSDTGGASWNLTLKGQATDVVTHPTSFNWQYAALGAGKGDPSNGVYRSPDSGKNWAKINGPWSTKTGGVGEIRFALAPSNSNILYVSVRDADDGKGKDGRLLGLWKTTNAWDPAPLWTEIPWNGPATTDYMVGRPHHVITVHPTNPAILYAGGVFLYKYDGTTWSAYSATINPDGSFDRLIHDDHNALAWVPPLGLLDGNDAGVVFKNEGVNGSLWQDRSGNLVLGALYSGDIKSNSVLAGVQDSGVYLRDGSSGLWDILVGGDGFDVFFGSSEEKGGWSMHAGQPVIMRMTTATPDGATVSDSIPLADLFSVPVPTIKVCPAHEDTVLFGGGRLMRSDNFFSAPTRNDVVWVANSDPVGVTAIVFWQSDATCKSYAIADALGKVYLTTDAGTHWKILNPGNELPHRQVTGIAFSPYMVSDITVTLSGFDSSTPGQPGHVFRTTNATASSPTWTDISPPVDIPHNVVVFDPRPPFQTIYVGTDLGIWSYDGSWTYSGPESGLPNAPVTDIAIDDCGVTVFTFGRGAFRQNVPFPCP